MIFSAKCIDQYTKLRNFNADCPADQRKQIDPRLEVVVNRMFDRCFQHKQYKQALGIAIESRRMDTFIKAIQESVRILYLLFLLIFTFCFSGRSRGFDGLLRPNGFVLDPKSKISERNFEMFG